MKPESPWDTMTSILPWNWFKIKEQQPVDSPSDSGSEKDEQTDYSITRKLEAVKVNATHPFMVTPISKPSQHIVFDESRVVPSRPDSRTTNTISSPKSIASSLLHKKKHGFSSIRKQQSRQQESIAKNMKSKFVPGFQAIKSKGNL